VAKEGGIFGDIFGKKEKNDPVAEAKAKQKAEAEERSAAAAKAQGKKRAPGRIPNKPKQEKSMTKGANLTVDGQWGASTTAAVQAALGQPLTGEAWINNADAKVLQQKLSVTADGLFGKGSNTALQKYLGVTADGIFGVESVKALQTRLNAGTFF
jgi:lysozyme family protein